jgi:hypothetical protein
MSGTNIVDVKISNLKTDKKGERPNLRIYIMRLKVYSRKKGHREEEKY